MRTAFVADATSGIGGATVTRFAAAGWRVVALGRRAERLAALRSTLGEGLLPLCVDIRDSDAVRSAVETLPDRFRGVDLLVNNAGTTCRRPPDADLDAVLAVVGANVTSLVWLARVLLPTLISRRGGIINLTAASDSHPDDITYEASKSLASHVFGRLHADLRGSGVRMTAIEPGRGDTTIVANGAYRQLDEADVADAMFAIAELPPHVIVERVEIMAVRQLLVG